MSSWFLSSPRMPLTNPCKSMLLCVSLHCLHDTSTTLSDWRQIACALLCLCPRCMKQLLGSQALPHTNTDEASSHS